MQKGEITLAKQRTKASNNRKGSIVNFDKAAKTRDIKLIPKSINQERYILSLLDNEQDIVIAYGPAGTGKTFLGMQAAIKSLQQGLCKRIVLTRPAVGVEEDHGFLPGTLEEKMVPWTRPLFDVIREYYTPQEITRMLENQIVELAPLAFMRGRNFCNSIIVFDEAQNSSINQMKMLLTRLGRGSKIIVTGDLDQKDRKFEKNNGLEDFINRCGESSNHIAICKLSLKDIQRHKTVTEVLNLYNK